MHSNSLEWQDLQINDADVRYAREFYAFAKAEQIFQQLKEQTPWLQNTIKIFGKIHNEPRLTRLYGDQHLKYGYSGIQLEALPWTPLLETIKAQVEHATGCDFNVCLINYYRTGADSNGWHADDEKELGLNPAIASLSLGQERYFHLKHHEDKSLRFKFVLHHGSLLLMSGQTQHCYKHQIAKTKRSIEPRLNLTFRKIVTSYQ